MSEKFLAPRLQRLGTETAFEVLSKAKALEKQGRNVIHFEIGEPDFETPKHIVNAGMKALESGETHYGPSSGIPQLKESIQRHILHTRNAEISQDQIVVTPGAKPVIFFSMIACIKKGDEVIYPNPGFPIYESMIKFVGGIPVALPLYEQKEFRFDLDELAGLVTPRTKMLILNSPHNPTGGILTKKELEYVANLAIKHDFLVFSDEIYDGVLYDGHQHESIFSFPKMPERTILLAGHSKNYAMTGWRLGYGIFPKNIAFYVSKLMVNSNSCTASFTQFAGVAALEGGMESTQKMVQEFHRRRDFIVKSLNEMGLQCKCPEGAFYVFPNVKSLSVSSKDFADLLLERYGVAVLDGECFGVYGRGYIRLSYANSMEKIKEGLSRIRIAVNELVQKKQNPASLVAHSPTISPTSASSLRWVVYNPSGTKRILVTKQMPGKRWLDVLLNANFRVEICTSDEILSVSEIKERIGTKCDGVIGQLTEDWSDELFSALKNAGGVAYSNMAVGYDNVNLDAATKNGILVGNTPGVLTETTSEMAMTLTFAASRRIVEADKFLRAGHYKGWLPNLFVGKLLHQKTLGIIGAGRIGTSFAKAMATSVKMDIIYYDLNHAKELEEYIEKFNQFLLSQNEYPILCERASSVDELLTKCDIVSLHTFLDKNTRHLIDSEKLSKMKKNAILVNTSRGPIIDERALVKHCIQNPYFYAALDVFENEPELAPGLSSLSNVIILPHISSATKWTRSGMALLASLNVLGVIKGYPSNHNQNDVSVFLQEKIPPYTPSLVNIKSNL